MKAFVHSLLGVVVGALLVTGAAFGAQTWLTLPAALQQQLNTRYGGAEAYGAATVTCATNGNFSITHGLGGTPAIAIVDPVADDATNGVEVESIGATTIVGRCFTEADGADVTSGDLDVIWFAKLAL